jgi:hypothetical protein
VGMADDSNDRAVYNLFQEAYKTSRLLSKEEIEGAANWTGKTFDTYYSKKLGGILAPEDTEAGLRYRVTDTLLRFPNFQKYKELVTQNRPSAADYVLSQNTGVVVYDFFMPLSNEGALRKALDGLFFTEVLAPKITSMIQKGLAQRHFPTEVGESPEDYLNRLFDYIDSTFGGYSVWHVAGRFKAGPLRSAAEASDLQGAGDRYLVDETTAVVRFIFPCGGVHELEDAFTPPDDIETDEREAILREANKVGFFFWRLFVESILRVVGGEDEIWMLESGFRSRLYRWKAGKKRKVRRKRSASGESFEATPSSESYESYESYEEDAD